jgi:hypothetical protein
VANGTQVKVDSESNSNYTRVIYCWPSSICLQSKHNFELFLLVPKNWLLHTQFYLFAEQT